MKHLFFSLLLGASLLCSLSFGEGEEIHGTLAKAKRIDLTAEQKAAMLPAADASQAILNGYDLYTRKCAYCHDAGIEKGASLRLNARYEGDVTKSVLTLRTDLTPELITTFVRNRTVGMPPFRITELSDSDLDDLIAYLTRNN